MVISFAAAQSRQLHERIKKVRTARALAHAYETLKPFRAEPEVARAVLNLRAAAERLGAL